MKILLFLCFSSLLLATNFPLKISSNGKYLEDQNGMPFFIAGDTPWSLIANSSYGEATAYLDAMETKGITAILTNLIEHEFADNAPNNYYNDAPFNTSGDFDTPNEDYFVFADSIINMAKTRGIVVFLTPCYMGFGCGGQGWAVEMGKEGVGGCGRWGSWVGKRYKDFDNIIWVGGGDADQSACDLISEHNAMMDSILYWDTDGLTTAHSYRTRSAQDDYDETWLNINSTYVDASIAAECNTTYGQNVWPAFLIEGYYENESGDMNTYLEQMYTPVLYARHMGAFFGNNPRWACASGWTNTYNSAGTKALGYFSKLFRSRPWWKLVPDRSHRVITVNYPKEVGIAADSSCLIAYFPSASNPTVNLQEISGDSSWAYWFNSKTGEVITIGKFINSGTKQFNANADMILVIDDYNLKADLPGTGDYTESIVTDNKPPTISNLSSVNFSEDDTLLFPVSAFYSYVEDDEIPDSLLKYSLKSGKYVFANFFLGDFVLTPEENWYGTDSLELAVSDGELTASANFYVTVNPINDAPYFVDLPDSIEFENDSILVFQMDEYIDDPDLPNDNLSMKFESNTDKLKWDFDEKLMILTVSAIDYVGIAKIYLTVTDDSMATIMDSITFKLRNPETTINIINDQLPKEFYLSQNYPNPFNPFTSIRISIPEPTNIKLTIYNMLGQKFGTIFDGFVTAGNYLFRIRGDILPSGIYFYELKTSKYHKIRKMMIIR